LQPDAQDIIVMGAGGEIRRICMNILTEVYNLYYRWKTGEREYGSRFTAEAWEGKHLPSVIASDPQG